MRCNVDVGRHTGRLEITNITHLVRENPDSVNVSGEMINELQRAQLALNRAEARILEQLIKDHPEDKRYPAWLARLNGAMLS